MRQDELFDDPADDDDGTPAHQRHSETSRAAARAGIPKLGTRRRVVLDAIRAAADGLTDEEGIARTGLVGNTYRPRRVELWRAGLIGDSKRTRKTAAGMAAVVWTAGPNGRAGA